MRAMRRRASTGTGPATVRSAAEALWPAPGAISLARRPRGAAGGGAYTTYAVVPSLRRPRYLVPRAPEVAVALRPAQGGFRGLPMLTLSYLQRWTLLHRLSARHLHVMAASEPGGIEDLLGAVVGDVAHVVVRLGQPRPNRTLVVWAFAADGTPLAIAKVGRGEVAQGVMETEYAALAQEPVQHVPGLVAPRALAYVRWHDSDVLVISALVSATGGPSHEPPVPQMRALAASRGVIAQPLRDTAFVDRLGREIDALVSEADRTWLADGLAALLRDHGDTVVRTGAWHGDWVSWNQLVTGERVLLWDWEHHASSALAGFDHVHFLAQEQRSRGTDIRNEDLWLGDAHAVLADAWDLDGDQRSAVLRGYLLEVNLRFVRDRQLDDAPPARAGWARELVERLTGPPQR